MSGKKYMGQGRPSITLTRSDIEYAIQNTKSASQAARFLNISIDTFKKNATQYRYKKTKKTLYDIAKNPTGKGIKRDNKGNASWIKYDLKDVLEGKHPDYDPYQLQYRLAKTDLYLDRRCSVCSFYETRPEDGKSPIRLDWINGDRTDHKLENLRWLCYNHYYIYVGWYGTAVNRDRYKNVYNSKKNKKRRKKNNK